MKTLSSMEIRQMFLDYFAQQGHQVMPSASLLPVNDPTLLWINSGVATLKRYFDGTEIPENRRITNSQKSIRTNDIENVGVTARHHTLFEMLGNFSIGDYFKKEAIEYAWEFLTSPEWLDLDPNLLYVTYYPEDEETKELWEAIETFDNTHLVPVEDNFWDIGAGPCGPDSEIFYDRGESFNNLSEDDPENYPGGENERWLEIWNLVFSEFNHLPDDTYVPLPTKNVDTGMGLERIVSVIQDTPTNFETDLFMPIIQEIETLTNGRKYSESNKEKVSFKVIADHIRAVTFAISDGALPSNEGRGYILRRLIRRSVMHGRRLGIKGLFLNKLVPIIAEIMGSYYETLNTNIDFVQQVIQSEEERFHETIDGGEQHLQTILSQLKESNLTEISGEQAFQLYDTYGFPLELTEEMALENGFTVDLTGFEVEMDQQRERARSARTKEESMSIQSDLLSSITTDFEFIGYTQLQTNATIKAIAYNDELVDQLPAQSQAWVFFNRSTFYAEMGGQIADTGGIYDGDMLLAEVLDVQKAPNGQFMHRLRSFDMPLNIDQSYTLSVDRSNRLHINQNHTATHLLHRSLKLVLGEHANQAGSYVGPDRLRFDFSHFGKVTDDELRQIANNVNYMIENAVDVDISEMSLAEAKSIGAMALFGEKYGDNVRVVNIGNESIELCGGTHVSNTNEIGTFKLVSESGIGAGIRRIEALTGQPAIAEYQKQEQLLRDIQTELKVNQTDQLLHRISLLQDELKASQSKVESMTAKMLQQEASNVLENVQTVDNITYVVVQLNGQGMDELRQLGDIWRQKASSNILVLVTDLDEKANLMVLVDDATVKDGIKAGDLIKPLAKIIGGGGGGRPQMAQAGGKNPAAIPQLVVAVPEEISRLNSVDA